MSVVLDARGLRKSYGAGVLLDGVDLSVSRGEKVGVIGRNGSGKTTLFRILAGVEGYEEGTIARKRGVTIGYLPQDPEMDPNRTIFETAGESRGELQAILAEYHAVATELGATSDSASVDDLLARQSTLSARIDEADGWDWGHRVEAVLTRVGVDGWERTMENLSGGERRRVALARALLSDPDLLLLDEPTNHLDAETVLWLEETLFDFAGAVVVITHDRYFLDRVVDRMVEVSDGRLTSYEGGYTEYLEARAEREARERVEEEKRSKLLEKELAWARRSPPARTGKQKARRGRAEELAEAQREAELSRTGRVAFEMDHTPRLGRKVLELHDIQKGYGEKPLIRGFSDRLLVGERIGVVGPNGVGKTTLLRLLVGEEEPDSGEVVLGENTRVGYFDQNREIDGNLTVERVVSTSDWVEVAGTRMHLRAYLSRFLFPPHVQRQKVSALSGGERNRLLLARLFLEEFNLLVLDEPTNDLDLDTLQVLEDTLESFPGCVVLVTHDRYLLDKLATSLWVFEGDGRIHRHHGRWDAYLAHREGTRAEATRERTEAERARRDQRARGAREQARRARSDGNRISYKERRELEGMEARIAELEEEKEELGEFMADPAFYREESSAKVSEVTRRYQELEGELEALYERWMELETRVS